MGWLTLLGIVAVAIGLVVVSRSAPEGGRPAGRTRLMTAARVVLLIAGLVVAAVWLQALP